MAFYVKDNIYLDLKTINISINTLTLTNMSFATLHVIHVWNI